MSNSFLQRGGWWVVGQFLLLIAIVVLGITVRATSQPIAITIGGLILLVVSAI